jgi:hypothetical protein
MGDRMTAPRRRLQIDDPLAAGQPVQPPHQPKPTEPPSKPRRRPRTAQQASSSATPAKRAPQNNGKPMGGDVWREWSGLSGVGSFRLPHELLTELNDTARKHNLPIGLLVTAAITQLLDQPAEQIAALVDRADDARIHGRRTNRRHLNHRAGR